MERWIHTETLWILLKKTPTANENASENMVNLWECYTFLIEDNQLAIFPIYSFFLTCLIFLICVLLFYVNVPKLFNNNKLECILKSRVSYYVTFFSSKTETRKPKDDHQGSGASWLHPIIPNIGVTSVLGQ